MHSLRAFSHLDIQSVLFSYENARVVKHSLLKSLNMKTGASAATSRQSSIDNELVPPPPPPPSQCDISSYRFSKASDAITFGVTRCSTWNLSTADNSNSQYSQQQQQQQLNSSTLVDECQCFRVERGGDVFKGLGLVDDVSQRRMMKLNSACLLDHVGTHYSKEMCAAIEANANEPFTIEYQDWGAYFYRYFFANQVHIHQM